MVLTTQYGGAASPFQEIPLVCLLVSWMTVIPPEGQRTQVIPAATQAHNIATYS